MSDKVTEEQRIEQSKKIIAYHQHNQAEHPKTEEGQIMSIYNMAISDFYDFIDTMIEHNPQHEISFRALKHEMKCLKLILEKGV